MFSKTAKSDFTPQDFTRILQNLSAQRELVQRQLQDGSISQKSGQEEMQRLSSLMRAYQNNLESALDEQRSPYSPN